MTDNQEITPAFDDELINSILDFPEGFSFECKRLKEKLNSTLESITAFANSNGGYIILGLEDSMKATGRDRIYGIQENINNWDELRRLIHSRITDPQHLPIRNIEIGCTLRDGNKGSIVVLHVLKSPVIHSIIGDGPFIRLDRGNHECPR